MPKTVLIVEDARSTRQVTRFSVEQGGYAVIEATNGAEGIEALAKNAVDLILTDLNMPHLNGLEMSKRIKSDERFKHLPILLLTPLFNQALALKAHEVGILAWIVKPFEGDKLLEAVRKVLGE